MVKFSGTIDLEGAMPRRVIVRKGRLTTWPEVLFEVQVVEGMIDRYKGNFHQIAFEYLSNMLNASKLPEGVLSIRLFVELRHDQINQPVSTPVLKRSLPQQPV